MEIAVQKEVPALQGLRYLVFNSRDLWEEPGTGRDPLPVQVVPTETAPVVPHDHAIRVEHWDDFENEFLTEARGTWIVAY